MQTNPELPADLPPSRAIQALAAATLGVVWFAGIAIVAALLLAP
jgi:hypothetical protein